MTDILSHALHGIFVLIAEKHALDDQGLHELWSGASLAASFTVHVGKLAAPRLRTESGSLRRIYMQM